MPAPAYTTRVRVTRERPPLRTAELLETGETVTFGTPGYQGDFYGLGHGELRERGGTFDYLVAAGGACLMGTFGRALTVRGIASDGGRLSAEAEGHVEVENTIMVMKRVTVRYRLRLDDRDQLEAAERAHAHHVGACGVALSVMPSLAIDTELEPVIGEAPLAAAETTRA